MPKKKERRYDSDGKLYTRDEFSKFYGDLKAWNSAKHEGPTVTHKTVTTEQPYVPTGGGNRKKKTNFGDCFEKQFYVPLRLRDKCEDFIGTVNDWHYAMLNDHPRNEHYLNALKAVITPGVTTCLEIGAGSGILTCIAAQLGAKRVTAIEANPQLVKLARQIVKLNGHEDRVTIVHGMSNEITLEQIGGEKADVLLSELFGTLLLSESAMSYISDARENFIKEGGVVVPQRACQFAQLVDSPDLVSLTSARSWNGIDLTPFNALQDTSSLVFSKVHGFRFSSVKHTMLTDPIPVLAVDFEKDTSKKVPEARHRVEVKESGTVHAVMASWEAYSGGAEKISTHPAATVDNLPRDMHWGQGIQLVEDLKHNGATPVPIVVEKGDLLDLVVTCSSNAVTMQFRVEKVEKV
eukprot:TRINITY_DN27221_c0_g1_i1.p1 TRINITY_DN27221_c0_g1~~TRINITY_DN27221_c0_g1_i1.p1  ORF type:complete len:420 (+),score=151.16 TRINITY_DN27221_c0_g1_i1:42-1262(+)